MNVTQLKERKTKNNASRWPNFVIIGGGKSGTTSLDYYLNQHPDIFMSPRKEPNFFGYELADEYDFLDDPSELLYYRLSVTDQENYLNLFKNATPKQSVGEVSVTYLYHEKACQQIHHHIPKAKIVVILRQPTERLYSRFLHLARIDQLPSENFSDCLDKRNELWWTRNDLVKEGFFYKHLSKFYKMFDAENIKVFLFEDLKSDPRKLMRELYDYIGVDSSFEPDMSIKLNTSGFIKNRLFNSVFGEAKGLIKTARALLPKSIYAKLKTNHKVLKIKNKIREKNLHKPKLDFELKKEVNEIYADDIKKLALLINRDLSHWLY
jgi:hypothetical protein